MTELKIENKKTKDYPSNAYPVSYIDELIDMSDSLFTAVTTRFQLRLLKEALAHYRNSLAEDYANSQDFRAVILVDGGGDIHVLDYTNDCEYAGLFPDGYGPDDNCITLDRAELQPYSIGLYHVKLKPWSDRDYTGEYDWGIRASVLNPIAYVSDNYLAQEGPDATDI